MARALRRPIVDLPGETGGSAIQPPGRPPVDSPHRLARTSAGLLGCGLFLALLLSAAATRAEPPRFAAVLEGMQAHLTETLDYQCRLETWSSNGDQDQAVTLAYAFRQPDQVRMEVIEGPYTGSLLIYNRDMDPNRVRVRAGNPLMAFLQRLIYGEYFAVDHQWVVDKRGNGIHESHWAHYLAERRKYLASGQSRSRFCGEAIIDGQKTYCFRLEAEADETPWGFHREDVWVNARSYFPVQLHQYDASGRLVRRAVVKALKFNTGIGPDWFRAFLPDNG